MRARDFAPVLSLVLVGCGGSGCSGGSTGGSSSGGGGSSSSGGGSTSAAADYEVHEWGLLRAQRDGTTEVLRAGAIAPPRPIEPMAVDKPVLYFHAGSPLTLRSVGVHVEGGAILETWPFVAGRTDVAWTDVALGSPTNCTPSALPSGAEPPCAALGPGAYCESPSLALVRTSEASCVTTHGATERFLFYRAQSTTFTPPLRFTRTEVYEDVRVDNDGDAPIPGVLVRIWSDGTHTRTLVAQPPPPHGSVVIGHGFDALDDDQQPADAPYDRRGSLDESLPAPTVSGPGRAGIRQTMTEIGLSGAEADAFFSAWDATLFSGMAANAAGAVDVPVDVLSVDGDPAPRESIVYFLPEAATNGVATLSFDPPPRTVHRALAIWTAIRASGEGR
ncbi:MAG: hypothetical protein K1X94_09910 [Sandaracinaceae bacterium]|nr:hypothetical protein [Sandaracinaceae bacterium]